MKYLLKLAVCVITMCGTANAMQEGNNQLPQGWQDAKNSLRKPVNQQQSIKNVSGGLPQGWLDAKAKLKKVSTTGNGSAQQSAENGAGGLPENWQNAKNSLKSLPKQ